MNNLIPLHIYVTEKMEIGATTDYKELPTNNKIIIQTTKEKIKELLENWNIEKQYKEIINKLKLNLWIRKS